MERIEKLRLAKQVLHEIKTLQSIVHEIVDCASIVKENVDDLTCLYSDLSDDYEEDELNEDELF